MRRSDCLKQRFTCFRVIERLPTAVNRRNTQKRQENRSRSRRCRRLAADFFTELMVLCHRRPHQGDRGIVLVELAILEFLGNRRDRPKVDHIQRPDRDHLRDPASARCGQTIGARRECPADQFVSKLRRRDIEYPCKHSVRNQAFHRLAPDTRRMKNDDFIPRLLEHLSSPLDTRSGHSKHRSRNQWSIFTRRFDRNRSPIQDHPCHRPGRIPKNGTTDSV